MAGAAPTTPTTRFLSTKGSGLPYAAQQNMDSLIEVVQQLQQQVADLQSALATAKASPPALTTTQLQQVSTALQATGTAPLKVTGLPSALGVL